MFGVRCPNGNRCWIRSSISRTTFVLGVTRAIVRMLACRTAQRDRSYAVDKITGLLLHGLALVVLCGTCGAVVGAQNTGFGLLYAARF